MFVVDARLLGWDSSTNVSNHDPVCKDFSEYLTAAKLLAPQCCPAASRCLSHRGLWSAPWGPEQPDLSSHSACSSCGGTRCKTQQCHTSVTQVSHKCPGLMTSLMMHPPGELPVLAPPAHRHPCLLLCCRTREKDSPLTRSHAGNTPASLKNDSE